ncbi:uncharacterized protein RAG0_07460 [Rhynchosporium agropyri]|uniref:Uncharacterized protein n=1 Tax=Rhynchosporium agropyri TaxID=914238 RepID=A0A1E1KLH7_9HELO|nr:uncharacterized protein RAG0_07460 [Rhynchosporium agropyri]
MSTSLEARATLAWVSFGLLLFKHVNISHIVAACVVHETEDSFTCPSARPPTFLSHLRAVRARARANHARPIALGSLGSSVRMGTKSQPTDTDMAKAIHHELGTHHDSDSNFNSDSNSQTNCASESLFRTTYSSTAVEQEPPPYQNQFPSISDLKMPGSAEAHARCPAAHGSTGEHLGAAFASFFKTDLLLVVAAIVILGLFVGSVAGLRYLLGECKFPRILLYQATANFL